MARTPQFPLELQKAMLGRATKSQLANQMTLQKKFPCTRSYVGLIANGARPASPEWIDAAAEAMGLPEWQRRRLKRAAAGDAGYEVTVDA